jgi:hypothetical protein
MTYFEEQALLYLRKAKMCGVEKEFIANINAALEYLKLNDNLTTQTFISFDDPDSD